MMRDFACPRSPSRMMSWPERIAFSSLRDDGFLVADDAREEMLARRAGRAIRFLRISSRTGSTW